MAKKEAYLPPVDPEKRARVAALYRRFGFYPPWELSPQQIAEEEQGRQEILARWEKPLSQTN